jgi:hypothetical protein
MSHPDWVTIRDAQLHQEEILQWVEQQRLVDEAIAHQRRTAPNRFYAPLLAFAGQKMVAWGTTLQAKYSRIHTDAHAVALATRK